MTKKYFQYWAEGFQIHVHTNGDLAMELVLDIVERLGEEQPRPGPPLAAVSLYNSPLALQARPPHHHRACGLLHRGPGAAAGQAGLPGVGPALLPLRAGGQIL